VTSSALAGNGRPARLESAGRRPSQYELFSVGQQPGLEKWLQVDWPVRFSDGRAPWVLESTALRCERWGDFRDPAQTWQRPYVAEHNHWEQAIAALLPEMLSADLAGSLSPAWRDQVLGTYYAAWPFVEYGEFLCLSYAVREALSDTLTFALAFEASDKLRHCQDIVQHLLTLAEVDGAFSDAGARAAWLGDPILVPLRETIERINSLYDWAEIAVAINLVIEPLVGNLFKTEFMARVAPLNGDPVAPLLLASARCDTERHLAFTRALVQLVTADHVHGSSNKRLVEEWLAKWTPHALTAARAVGRLFELPGIVSVPCAPRLERVIARQRQVSTELGLEVP
jgi:methane monooxygenase component A beta chain/propane monooxygenase small subunit